jgi:hypothetical protein
MKRPLQPPTTFINQRADSSYFGQNAAIIGPQLTKFEIKQLSVFSENLRQNLSTDNDYTPAGRPLDERFRFFQPLILEVVLLTCLFCGEECTAPLCLRMICRPFTDF